MSKLKNDFTAKRTNSEITGNESLLNAAKDAAELLGFLSHHLRGRLPDAALLDMASKADRLISEIEGEQ